jgi:hypothetical protein
VALEGSAGFAAGLAFGLFAFEEGLGLGVVAGLGQREAIVRQAGFDGGLVTRI